ncbi:MAG: hypothetical protein Q8P32_00070 [Candidatus Komeilibacteria bacterium]|nr:hypothetical protein [Candidatus Komeilibacteria bacterium]
MFNENPESVLKQSIQPSFEEAGTPEAERPRVIDQLRALKSAELTELKIKGLEDYDVLRLDITDKELWESPDEARKLVPAFGKMAYEVYGSQGKRAPYDPSNQEMVEASLQDDIVDGDISLADKMFIVAKGDKVAGFLVLSFEELNETEKTAYVPLTIVDPEHRGEKLSKELYRMAFAVEGISAFTGFSARPEAVKNRLEIGKEFGFTGFYAGYKDGQFGEMGTPEEQAKVKELTDLAMGEAETAKEKKRRKETPYGYVVYDKSVNPIAPITESDLKFEAGDPLGRTFREGLLPVQEKFSPHTVYGALINIKNPEQS